jgi:hypothetical protein
LSTGDADECCQCHQEKRNERGFQSSITTRFAQEPPLARPYRAALKPS